MALSLTMEDFDRLPKLARQAMADSIIIGNGSSKLTIKRAKAEVMAERIRRCDILLTQDNNTVMPTANLQMLNDILHGKL